MASIEDRWWKRAKDDQDRYVYRDDGKPEMTKTSRHGAKGRWRVRWREPDGTPDSEVFDRKSDAEKHKTDVEHRLARGSAGPDRALARMTFNEWATEWLAQRTNDPLSVENTRDRLRRYVTNTQLGGTPLGKIRPSTIQTWLKGLTIAPTTARTVFAHVASILAAAVDDDAIDRNPCKARSVTPPKPPPGAVVPWLPERVAAVRAALDSRYAPLVTLGAGLGLRPGEIAGLSPDDIDWPRGEWVHVRRQVKLVNRRRVFAPPKGGKTRHVPLSPAVRDEIAAYLATYPAQSVTLPWGDSAGKPTAVALLMTGHKNNALHESSVRNNVWVPALKAAGVPVERVNGLHALRHLYASAQLDAGENIKALATYLGHSDAGFTLRTYTHLMPNTDGRARDAIDAMWQQVSRVPHVSQRDGSQSLYAGQSVDEGGMMKKS